MKLMNVGNTAYLGELYVGAPVSQKLTNIVFDTGSDIFAVMSNTCKNCPKADENTGNYYDKLISRAAHSQKKSANETYGSAAINGLVMNDTVCLDQINLKTELDDIVEDEELLQLDNDDLVQEDEREFNHLIQLVDSQKNCISQFPFLAVEQQ